MLNLFQFETLKAYCNEKKCTQRDIAAEAGISLGSVNKAYRELKSSGYIGPNGAISKKGVRALAPYKVDNAIILAAGMATRFAPLSFEKPKALFEVRGEIIIERMIRQLKEAGIEDITVVVGYMKEALFYLEDDFNVKIVVNPEYAARNNHSSLYSVRNILGNTYVCNSDEYYTKNIFSNYVFRSCCAACFGEDITDEYVFHVNGSGRITKIVRSGTNSYFSRGPAFFNRAFSEKIIDIIEASYMLPETKGKLWDDILMENTTVLEMYMKTYDSGTIFEFDYLTDLVAFDRDFFANVDSKILDNICLTLECKREDITEVTPIKAGLTNLSTLFTAKGTKYIYRHPGNGTEEIINREAERYALDIARDLELDDTFVFQSPEEGWKISRYIEGCSELDYHDHEQVKRALQMARKLHTSGKKSPYSFDFYNEGVAISKMLLADNYPLPRDFNELSSRVGALAKKMRTEVAEPVLCHNDFYGPNFLVRGNEMRLIDWEYAAMGDPACDLGNFVAQGSGYSIDETLAILPLYYGRAATEIEKRHCLGAVGVVGWYWYVWAMYKEALGNPMGEWLYIWYRAAKQFTEAAEKKYL